MAQFRTDKKIIDSNQILTRYEVNGLMESISPSGTHVDSYGRFRVSEGYELFTSQRVGARQYKFDEKLTGSATSTYSVNESSMLLNVGTANGDEVIRESFQVVPFQPGKSIQVLMSFIMNDPKQNLRQRVGFFDDKNGVYFENDGVTNYFVIRSYTTGTVIETRVPQSEWNFDRFDGNGYSSQACRKQFIPDPSEISIFWMDVASFTSRHIRMGFVANGRPYIGHLCTTNLSGDAPTLTTLSLPFRYEIKNTGITGSSSTLRQINCAASSEGGFQLSGLNEGASRGYTIAEAVNLPVAGREYPLFSYRLKSDRRNNVVIPNNFHIYVDSNATVSYRIWVNAIATGGVWETNNPARHVEYNRGVTGFNTTNGRVVQGGFVIGGASVQSNANMTNLNYTLGRFLNGTTQEIILTVIPTQANIKVLVKADWIELV
jgi:hypothetical protein